MTDTALLNCHVLEVKIIKFHLRVRRTFQGTNIDYSSKLVLCFYLKMLTSAQANANPPICSISTGTERKYSINHAFLDNGIISHQHAWFWGLVQTQLF